MAGIGGVTCLMVKGEGLDNTQRVEVYQVPGHDGYGALKLGLGDSAWSFRGVLLDSLANVNTWVASLQALKGAVISVVDDFGTTHTNLLVREVSPPQRDAVVHLGTLKVRGEMRLRGVVRTV